MIRTGTMAHHVRIRGYKLPAIRAEPSRRRKYIVGPLSVMMATFHLVDKHILIYDEHSCDK